MKEVAMTAQIKIKFTGAFDNCHIGCDSCDFVSSTHTQYKDLDGGCEWHEPIEGESL